MPQQSAVTSVLARFGAKFDSFVTEHATDAVDYGFRQLPPGISNGIAQLTGCEFGVVQEGKQNAGQPYLRFEAVAQRPESIVVQGSAVEVKGTQFSQFVMLCEQTTSTGKVITFQENISRAMNEMKKLGADLGEIRRLIELEPIAAALAESKPFFRFNTELGKATKEYPNPRVWTYWNGNRGLEEYDPAADETPLMNDQTGTVNGVAVAPGGKDFSEFQDKEAAGGDDDLDALLAQAETQDQDAIDRLTEVALAAGVSQEMIDRARTWSAVGILIRGARADSEGGEEKTAAAPEREPAREDICKFTPTDPKTNKPYVDARTKKPRGPIDVEVISVSKKNRTVDVRELDNPKVCYKSIPWDQLQSA